MYINFGSGTQGPFQTVELDEFTAGYISCALWASTDESREDGGDPLDDNYDESDLADEAVAEMIRECEEFREANADDLDASGLSEERQGHDFWLTRNRHGAGFWDEGIGEVGARLTDAAHAYGSCNLYVDEEKKIRIV